MVVLLSFVIMDNINFGQGISSLLLIFPEVVTLLQKLRFFSIHLASFIDLFLVLIIIQLLHVVQSSRLGWLYTVMS